MSQLAQSLARASAAAAAVVMLAAPAAAGWPFNMPSNVRQQLGVGFGPGYHAPLVLATPCRAPLEAQRIQYRFRAPQVSDCFGGQCTALAMPQEMYTHAAPAYPQVTPGSMPPYSRRYAPLSEAQQPTPADPDPVVVPRSDRSRRQPASAEQASPSDRPAPESIPLPVR
ncbi:MAG: hypothetical protein AAGJ46_07205 [Planctomycetota bacterium]